MPLACTAFSLPAGAFCQIGGVQAPCCHHRQRGGKIKFSAQSATMDKCLCWSLKAHASYKKPAADINLHRLHLQLSAVPFWVHFSWAVFAKKEKKHRLGGMHEGNFVMKYRLLWSI
jgi:hypothetical protein